MRQSDNYHMVLKYPGSKHRIARWIVDKLPVHHSYLEPFFGSGAVFFNKMPSAIETINDLDDDVINLFRLIRNDSAELINAVNATPYARKEYENAYADASCDDIEKARRFLIRCWQGYGYRTNSKVGWKNDVQGREAAYCMRDWYRLPGWIANIADRLKTVQIEHRPAVDVIRRFNYPNVCVYADPPYLGSTRSRSQYRFEMLDEQDHVQLLETLLEHKGSVVLSGYDSALYNELLAGWKKYQIDTTAEGGKPRTESLWIKEVK